jgi:hypothetical protein
MVWKYNCMNSTKESQKAILIYFRRDTGGTEKDDTCKH